MAKELFSIFIKIKLKDSLQLDKTYNRINKLTLKFPDVLNSQNLRMKKKDGEETAIQRTNLE